MERMRRRGVLIGPLLLLGAGLFVGVALWRYLMLDGGAGVESLSAGDRHALARVLERDATP
ncbi:MAG: hypothetical protein U0807_15550 [Candidatus Binatia bacterium]